MTRHVSILVTGAPLAARFTDVAAALIDDGWTASISATEAALPWIDADHVDTVTGSPLRVRYRDPTSPSAKDPDAVVVCPATFNTVGKAALGIADTYVHSVLCEAIWGRHADRDRAHGQALPVESPILGVSPGAADGGRSNVRRPSNWRCGTDPGVLGHQLADHDIL